MPVEVRFGSRVVACSAVIFDKDGTLLDGYRLWEELAGLRTRILKEQLEEQYQEQYQKQHQRQCRRQYQVKDRAQEGGRGLEVGDIEGIEGAIAEIIASYRATLGIGDDGAIDRRGPLVLASCRDEVVMTATTLYQHGFRWDDALIIAENAYSEAERSLSLEAISIPVEGAYDILRDLIAVGVATAVATTDTHARAEATLRTAGLEDVINIIVGVDDVERGKPHPDAIFRVCKELGVSCREAVYVGDTITDMRTGHNASVACRVGVLTGAGTREALEPLADVVLESVKDISVCHHPGARLPHV
ncbi:MAG: HAD family hydrolase [Firmicutes bacterium]|nr:HAD family hydrolase [Bacillota bacterium]